MALPRGIRAPTTAVRALGPQLLLPGVGEEGAHPAGAGEGRGAPGGRGAALGEGGEAVQSVDGRAGVAAPAGGDEQAGEPRVDDAVAHRARHRALGVGPLRVPDRYGGQLLCPDRQIGA
ncbi:hypothetical protein ACWDYJ_34775 [Streptomyces sp. NPDC003042]